MIHSERQVRMPLVANLSGLQSFAVGRIGRLGLKAHPGGRHTVKVLRVKEKGSDVNLATHLLADGCRGKFEKAIVFSNDTDLCEPIRVVVEELHLPVVVVNPRGHRRPAARLAQVATTTRSLRLAVVASSQLPTTLQNASGRVHKPANW